MRCWLSAAQAAYHSFPSLPPTKTRSLRCTAFFPPKPLHWVSAGALLGEVIKLPFCIFSAFLCGGGITTLGPLWLCRNNPARGLFRQKNGFLRVGALCRRTRCSLLHTALFRRFCKGGGITTLGVRFMLSKRWTPAGHGGLFAVFMPPQCSPCVGRISTAGTHATPAPNRAHSGSHAETRRVLRVDGDDVSGSGIIDTIDPFQADQTVAVALAEGHRNAVSP